MSIKVQFFLIGFVVATAIAFVAWTAVYSGKSERSADYVAVETASRDIQCPDGATLEFARWGESGWLVKCQLNHGPFVAAEHGHVVLRNEYSMGKLVSEKTPHALQPDGTARQ